jgi:hypothetical protein
MRDLIFQGIVVLLPFFYGVGIEACPKDFRDTPRYRRWALICGAVFSLVTFCELGYERHKSTAERETAVENSAAKTAAILGKQYAASDAAQKLKIGELEGFIQSQGKDVRDVMKSTAANTEQLRLLREQNETGKQKRQTVIDEINNRIKRTGLVFDTCRSVGPPGSGGSHPEGCNSIGSYWITEVRGYILGSLGQTYADRFDQAGNPTHLASAPRLALDPRSAPLIELQVREVESRVDALKEFVKELENNSLKSL